MEVTTERLPRSRVALDIEVDQDRVDASMEKAVRKVAQEVKIPGFRPGKAPRHIVERTVGGPALLQEAIDLLLPDIYTEVLEAEAVEAIGQPELELKSTEPLVVHFTVPVRPTVELNDYRSLRAPREEANATPEQIEETVLALRRRMATLEPVDRPVQWDDTVRVDVTVDVEGQDEPHVEEGAEFRVQEGSVVSLPGFVERLIGLERGATHEFSFQLPEDFEASDLAGKTARYEVRLHEVKQEILPDLDDDFAVALDQDFETAEQVREWVEKDVQEHVTANALAAYHDEVVDLLVAGAELDYPDVMVEREIDGLVDVESNHASHTPEELERWLERVGKTEEEVRDELRPGADAAVRRALVLGELLEREEIEVPPERIEEEMELLLEGVFGGAAVDQQQRDVMRGALDTEETRTSVSNRLRTQAALDRLVEICSQPDEEPEAKPRPSRRRRSRRAAEGGESAQAAEGAGADGDVTQAEPGDRADGESETGDGTETGAQTGE